MCEYCNKCFGWLLNWKKYEERYGRGGFLKFGEYDQCFQYILELVVVYGGEKLDVLLFLSEENLI